MARGTIAQRRAALKRSAVALSGAAGFGISGFRLNFRPASRGRGPAAPGAVIKVLKHRYGRFGTAGTGGLELAVSPAAARQAPFRPKLELENEVLSVERGDFKAVISLASGKGTLAAAPNEQSLDAFLRSLLSSLLIRSGGLMLHSAGVVKDGKAFIFPGRSGAGKSTLSKLAAATRGVEVISDEINMLRFEGGRWLAYGSPFWGEMRSDGRPGCWPLGGLFLLKKARRNKVSACAQAEVYRLLLRCTLNFSRASAASAAAMLNAARLLAAVPARKLEFSRNDPGSLELIRI